MATGCMLLLSPESEVHEWYMNAPEDHLLLNPQYNAFPLLVVCANILRRLERSATTFSKVAKQGVLPSFTLETPGSGRVECLR